MYIYVYIYMYIYVYIYMYIYICVYIIYTYYESLKHTKTSKLTTTNPKLLSQPSAICYMHHVYTFIYL